jgi:hypothetical protein
MPDSHSQFEEIVAQFLHGMGYPSTSLVHEPLLLPAASSDAYRPDIGILDPTASEYLAVIEVQGRNDSTTIVTASDRLRKYVQALGTRPIDAFLAVPGHAPDAVSFYRFTPGSGAFTLIRAADFPKYDALRSRSLASSRTAVRAGIKRTTDRFRIMSWSIATAAVLLAASDFALEQYLFISLLSAERLALLGVAAALMLVPDAAKLKGFGLEFERMHPHEGDRDPAA